MKKITVTILAFLYLAVSSGAVVHMHYCMGKLVSSGFWYSKAKSGDCPICGMTKKKGCCEDRHKVIKIDKQYDANQFTISIAKLTPDVREHNSTSFNFKSTSSLIFKNPLSNSPPGTFNVPLYITNCVYRI